MKLVVSAASGVDAEAILAPQKLAYESEARLYGDWGLAPLTQTLGLLRARMTDGTLHRRLRTVCGIVRNEEGRP